MTTSRKYELEFKDFLLQEAARQQTGPTIEKREIMQRIKKEINGDHDEPVASAVDKNATPKLKRKEIVKKNVKRSSDSDTNKEHGQPKDKKRKKKNVKEITINLEITLDFEDFSKTTVNGEQPIPVTRNGSKTYKKERPLQ